MGTGAIFVWSTLILSFGLGYGLKRRYPEEAIQAKPYVLLFAGNVFALVSMTNESAAMLIIGVAMFGYGYYLLYTSQVLDKSKHQDLWE